MPVGDIGWLRKSRMKWTKQDVADLPGGTGAAAARKICAPDQTKVKHIMESILENAAGP